MPVVSPENVAPSSTGRELAEAVDWLERRLRQITDAAATRVLIEGQPVKKPTWRFWPWTSKPPAAAPTAIAPAPPVSPPRLAELARRLELDPFERDTLLLCFAAEIDSRISTLCGLIQHNGRSRPTLELAAVLFGAPGHWPLSPRGKLRAWRLLDVEHFASESPMRSALSIDSRIIDFLSGNNDLDERLANLVSWVPPNLSPLPASHEELARSLRIRLAKYPNDGLPVVQLLGRDPSSKTHLADQLSADLRLYRFPAQLLPSQINEVELLAMLWRREHRLSNVALLLDAQEVDAHSERAQSICQFVGRLQGSARCFIAVRDRWSLPCGEEIVEEVGRPTRSEQAKAWTFALGPSVYDAGLQNKLASQFNLSIPHITDIAAIARGSSEETSLSERLSIACQAILHPAIEPLARRIDARATWDDIVVPEKQLQLLQQIVGQVSCRQKVYDDWGFARRLTRGLGISALFTGESGTGKTMAAEVIANDLGLSLYVIDLSAVVSKYIGETEKNLARVFDAAEDGGGILFFDECDALFGKRSEVKDSHDRYANIEINYLLQRIEAYSGLAILATNMKNALDTAFVRRLRFSVSFAFPGETERRRIWEKVFPVADEAHNLKGTPLESLDYAHLAHWNLTGANIQSIALNAAFRAAAINSAVTMELIEAAARDESLKLGRPINDIETKTPAMHQSLIAARRRLV